MCSIKMPSSMCRVSGYGSPFPPAAPGSGCKNKEYHSARGRHCAAPLVYSAYFNPALIGSLFCHHQDALLNKANQAEGASR
ncbi:hypothetical protein AERO9A_370148 [Aeromonas salmonicida]|nr:hypothetical protein AERO9A_370148 [Aeromonas salmonicida]